MRRDCRFRYAQRKNSIKKKMFKKFFATQLECVELALENNKKNTSVNYTLPFWFLIRNADGGCATPMQPAA